MMLLTRLFRRRTDAAVNPPPPREHAPGLVEEIEALRERHRLLGAFFGAAARLAQCSSGADILQALCASLVEATPHIRLAWAWRGPVDTASIKPQVYCGPARAYAEALDIPRNRLTEQGPAFRALAGQVDAAQVHALAPFKPWRAAVSEHGIQVAAALPIDLADAQERVVLVFYADDLSYFERVGFEPFAAFARFGQLALARVEAEQSLKLAAHSDALTGLANRRATELALAEALAARASRTGAEHLLLIDIDHFKRINDAHGHAGGDRVLQAVSRGLVECLRRGDLVARWGGEEFLVLLGGPLDVEQAQAVAERLRQGIADLPMPIAIDPARESIWARVSISVGGASLSQLPEELRPHDWVHAADDALYRAKREGRNRVAWSRGGVSAPARCPA